MRDALTPEEVATRLGRSRSWVYQRLRQGVLRGVKDGAWLVPVDEVDRYLGESQAPSNPPPLQENPEMEEFLLQVSRGLS